MLVLEGSLPHQQPSTMPRVKKLLSITCYLNEHAGMECRDSAWGHYRDRWTDSPSFPRNH